jgi:PAS domain S-box-containing protein
VGIVENGDKTISRYHKKMMYLHQQISEFEKLDIEHRRNKSITWPETEAKYLRRLERTNKNACIIQDAKIRLATQNFAELLGYTPGEIIDTLVIRYIHPDELPRLVKNYKDRLAGEDVPAVYKTILKHKDGSDIYVEINAGLIPYRGNPADFTIIKCLTKKKR